MNQYFKIFILIISLSLFTSQIFGQAKLFAPEIFKTNDVFGLAISPDGKEIFFVKSWGGRDSLSIYHAKKGTDNQWTEPVRASFSCAKSGIKEIDPIFSPDGRTLIFNSTRPTPQNPDKKDFDIWIVKKKTDGSWGNPIHLGETINSDSTDFYASVANNGNIYFTSARQGKYGKLDIYKSEYKNGTYQTPTNLGTNINSDGISSNPFIAPDESYLIFFSFKEVGFGDSDLYISFNKEGHWTKPVNLGKLINTEIGEFCPSVSGKHFYFSRMKKGGKKIEENICQIEMKHLKINQLKTKSK